MKTKPFNLEQAKAGKSVVTNEGHPAKYMFTAENNIVKAKYIFTYKKPDGNEYLTVVDDMGICTDSSNHVFVRTSLLMVLEEKEYWIATIGGQTLGYGCFYSTNACLSEEEAIETLKKTCNESLFNTIQTHKITRYE